MSDDAKKIVLARRARFVAAAIASVGIACGKEPVPPPQPCLSPIYVPPEERPGYEGGAPADDAGAPGATPADAAPPDAGPPDAGPPDALRGDAGGPHTGARPLQPTPIPTVAPSPCLSVRRTPPTRGR
jgi:hypothetical protein